MSISVIYMVCIHDSHHSKHHVPKSGNDLRGEFKEEEPSNLSEHELDLVVPVHAPRNPEVLSLEMITTFNHRMTQTKGILYSKRKHINLSNSCK